MIKEICGSAFDIDNDMKDDGFNINTKYLQGRTLGHYIVKRHKLGLLGKLSKLGLNLNVPVSVAYNFQDQYGLKNAVSDGLDNFWRSIQEFAKQGIFLHYDSIKRVFE